MASKRTLVIDGNYMLKRFLREYDFVVDPAKDRNNFLIDLSQHIACEIERVQGFCDNIIMCKDSRSWRKNVPIVKPISHSDSWLGTLVEQPTEVANYKSNRKQSDDRNWELIYSTFNDFCDCLNQHFNVPFVCVPGAEGDDCIWAATTYLRNNKIKSCVYCTDSDINQLVTPSNVILRRVKSKAAPEGEIVVHPAYWKVFTESTDTDNPLALFEYDITQWAPDMEMFKNRTLGNGISITFPYWFVLVHMIVGSVKDNVPELFTWPAKSITRHIQPKHIECALALGNMKKEQIREEHLYDEPFLKALIINLCHATQQPQYINHLEYLYKMLVCNRKLNYLSAREIPEDLQNRLFQVLDIQKNMEADMKSLGNANLIMEQLRVSKDKMFQELGI